MAQMQGKFNNYKNENLDEFYAAIGVPWIGRKMMTSSHPTIEISQADDQWTLKTSSLMSTTSYTFKMGEEYEETMKGGRTLKCVTTMEEGKIVTNCVSDQGKSTRLYEFNDEGFVMNLTHEKTDIVAKRYFKRA